MKSSTTLGAGLFGAMLAFGFTARADAQLVNGRWQVQPPPAGSIAVQAPPPIPTIMVFPSPMGTLPTSRPIIFPAQPIAFTLVPTIVMSDGSVFADFGFGFEPVQRGCDEVIVAQQGVLQPTVVQPTIVDPAGHVLSQGGQITVATPVTRRCFRRDLNGRVFVIR